MTIPPQLSTLQNLAVSPAELEEQVDEWVKQPEIGLRFDPFRKRDAGSDPKLPLYLVDSGTFASLWKESPYFVFAPAGGGKTAFRVRLTHACRVGEDRRRIFPIVLTTLDPGIPLFESLMQAAASELLLHLLFSPPRFFNLDQATKHAVRRVLDESLVESLPHRLEQIEDLLDRIRESDDWNLLAESFDPAASGLFSPPTIPEVQRFIAALRSLPSRPANKRDDPQTRFDRLQTLLRTLNYETIYVLVDGVDAYLETQRDPKVAIDALRPLLERAREWAERRIYLKCFLPLELCEPLQKTKNSLLTKAEQFDTIEWQQDDLRRVIGQRLQAASGEYRAVTSLDALCTPALRGVEDELLEEIRQPLPREAVMVVEQTFIEHVRRVGPQGRLEPEDLDAAKRWYRRLKTTWSS